MIRSGNVFGAAELVRSANAMAHVCGKVCPEEIFCQSVCTRGKQDSPIAIRELHYHATLRQSGRGDRLPAVARRNERSIAVIGGGPAGLACAFTSARLGYRVTLYDRDDPGGVPARSIPLFRLARADVDVDTSFLMHYINFRQEEIDRESFLAIERRNDALFVATGLTLDKALPIPGAELQGVMPVLNFLRLAREGEDASGSGPITAIRGKRVIVVGGGNVSLDAAATAKRSGCGEITLMYRRGPREMRVWNAELEEARNQGVEIQYFVMPVEILGSDCVTGVRCQRTRLSGRSDSSGRGVPEGIERSEFVLQADLVIPAIGQAAGAEFLDLFERTPQGTLKVDAAFATSRPRVFAGGDLISGEGTIVQSVGHGTEAAHAIHRFLSGGRA